MSEVFSPTSRRADLSTPFFLERALPPGADAHSPGTFGFSTKVSMLYQAAAPLALYRIPLIPV
jgi:hypothetical protein